MSPFPETDNVPRYGFEEPPPRQAWLPRLAKLGAIIVVGLALALMVAFWAFMTFDPVPGPPAGRPQPPRFDPALQARAKKHILAEKIIAATPVPDLVTAELLMREYDMLDNPRALAFIDAHEIGDEGLTMLHFRVEEDITRLLSYSSLREEVQPKLDLWHEKLRRAIAKAQAQDETSPATKRQGLALEHLQELGKVLAMDPQREREGKYNGFNPALPMPSAAERAATEQARLVQEQLKAKARERTQAYVDGEMQKPIAERWKTPFEINGS